MKLLPLSPKYKQPGQNDPASGSRMGDFMSNHPNLEKSKSDSKLDRFAQQQQQPQQNQPEVLSPFPVLSREEDEDRFKRSNSNQHMERKLPSKKKKAKSFSKLSELDKEVSVLASYTQL